MSTDRQRSLQQQGFGNATHKAGVPHLTAPPGLLSRMLTLRISLDPKQADNGPLVVQPGSHLVEHEHDADLERAHGSPFHEVRCEAGDVVAMRPLLAHSS